MSKIDNRFQELITYSDAEIKSIAERTNINEYKNLLKPFLVPRLVDTPQHQNVLTFMKNKLREYNFTIEQDDFVSYTPFGNKTFRNLIATFDPLNNIHRRLVLACHYDSKYIPNSIFIGATDSAVPCAMMLDVARTLNFLLKQQTKEVALQLIFLDGEEAFLNWNPSDSIYGARHLSQLWHSRWYPSTHGSSLELSKEIDRIDVFVLMDLLGHSKPVIRNFVGNGMIDLFKHFNKIEKDLKRLQLTKSKWQIFYPESLDIVIEDDHIPFRDLGVPILHLISVPFPSVWHTSLDNENALDYDSIYNLLSILRVFVARYMGLRPLQYINIM